MAPESKLNVSKQRPDPTKQDAKGKTIISSSLAPKRSSGSSMAKPVSDPKLKSVAMVTKSEKRFEVSSTKQAFGLKPKVESTTVRKEVKGKETASSSKSITKTASITKLKEKKVYSLPGQKYDIPEERDPLRIFYESLMEQIPSSEMAEFWMMEHGLLSPEKAKKALEKKQRKQNQMRMGTPIKSPKIERTPKIEKPESSAKPLLPSRNGEVKPKKRSLSYSDDDDDFIVKHKRGRV